MSFDLNEADIRRIAVTVHAYSSLDLMSVLGIEEVLSAQEPELLAAVRWIHASKCPQLADPRPSTSEVGIPIPMGAKVPCGELLLRGQCPQHGPLTLDVIKEMEEVLSEFDEILGPWPEEDEDEFEEIGADP